MPLLCCHLRKRVTPKLFYAITLTLSLIVLAFFGVFTHLLESNFPEEFDYPYSGDIVKLIQQMRSNVKPDVAPINVYNYKFLKAPEKCNKEENIALVFLIKSSRQNFMQRAAIRETWAKEDRFNEIGIKIIRVFLVGQRDDDNLDVEIDKEHEEFNDLVQANFTDHYFNNTFKTMMGFNWAMNYCNNSKFFMLADDDFYISTKNLLGFVSDPFNYPHYKYPFEFHLGDKIKLYSGFVLEMAPPLRSYFNKWYMPLKEYRYHLWPPFVPAGAVIMSREALIDLYYASLYTKHFRFDDIYLSILAYKANIRAFHCNHIYISNGLEYSDSGYKDVIAVHYWDKPDDLLTAWSLQNVLGNA